MEVQSMKISDVKPYPHNPRKNDSGVEAVANSIKEFGWQQPIVVDKDHVIIVGHTRYKAAKKLGMDKVPVVVADGLTDEQVRAYRLADNKTGELTDWDTEQLDIELGDILDLDMSDFGFDLEDDDEQQSSFDKIMSQPNEDGHSLADDFIIFPASVLDTRKGGWKERKDAWKSLGIQSEIGRDENLAYSKSLNMGDTKGTSIFDPVLTELLYRWFIPKEGCSIYDPFAGGSVRGVVAASLGYNYMGIDLRPEQVQANYDNAKEIGVPETYTWYADDSQNVDEYIEDGTQDFVIACPPYLDLEVYSDDPKDLSTMDDEAFDEIYTKILGKAVRKLKPNRFAAIIVSDVRYHKGTQTGYRDLVGMTTNAMLKAGCCLYNDMVLLNQVGSKAITTRKAMESRKVARVHQNVLVYYKGDTRKIRDEFPPLKGLGQAIEQQKEEEEAL